MAKVLLRDEADFVIVGTGAGGATAARVLSASGAEVVMLEEGVKLDTKNRPRDVIGALAQAARDAGSQATSGGVPMPILQGRCVGGSTAINSGIIWRMPDDVVADWSVRHGLGELVDPAAIGRVYEQLEDELEVSETTGEIRGRNVQLMAAGAEALGLPGKPMSRNAARCEGNAECLQGCPGERRQSMDVSYVPRALESGARLHTLCRVTKVLVEGGKAVGVVGDVLDRETRKAAGKFEIRARRGVVVSAGAIHTPLILHRTGLRGLVGQRFQAHPGSAMVGRFPEPVAMGYGATQGYEVPMRNEGFKIESLSLPPEMLAARLPGAGAEWQERLAHMNHFAQWCAQVRMEAHGTVRPGWGGAPVIRYEPTGGDLRTIQYALALICRMMFAAGAVEVYPGLGQVPEVLKSVEEVRHLEEAKLTRGDMHLVASHLFGTACAGSDASRSVVGPDLMSHDVDGLFVMDASVFPTNMGVNPQHSIMAVVFRASEWLAEGRRVRATA